MFSSKELARILAALVLYHHDIADEKEAACIQMLIGKVAKLLQTKEDI